MKSFTFHLMVHTLVCLITSTTAQFGNGPTIVVEPPIVTEESTIIATEPTATAPAMATTNFKGLAFIQIKRTNSCFAKVLTVSLRSFLTKSVPRVEYVKYTVPLDQMSANISWTLVEGNLTHLQCAEEAAEHNARLFSLTDEGCKISNDRYYRGMESDDAENFLTVYMTTDGMEGSCRSVDGIELIEGNLIPGDAASGVCVRETIFCG